MLISKVQQQIRSDQDTNPVVSDSIQARFTGEEQLLNMVETLGELKLRKYAYRIEAS